MIEKNFVVLYTQFYGGKEISRHTNLKEAMKVKRSYHMKNNCIDVATILPLNEKAQEMLVDAINEKYGTYCDKYQFPIYEK
jgi:hypothetical protein